MSSKEAERSRRRRPARWYLLIHQLPPEPLYLRAKIRQRLARVGAVALKNAVYVMPRREECLEDLQWIAEEAVAGGGDAYVCEAVFLERRTDAALVERFRSERDADYRELAQTVREWEGKARSHADAARGEEGLPAQTARARKHLEEIARVDFFRARGRAEAERLLAAIERRLRRAEEKPAPPADRLGLAGRTWTTRKGIQIDRIASAWLIRRFIDSKARFRFIDPREPARAGELRFDTVGGDFSHEGDRCTFETLLARAGAGDRALSEIAEIVHDIDLKDGKFGRPEAAGVERLLNGLVLAHREDDTRLERGFALFDDLYQSFRKKTPTTSKEASQ